MTFLENIQRDLADPQLNGGSKRLVIITRKPLEELMHQFEQINSEAVRNERLSHVNRLKNVIIEQAEDMATSSENYLRVMNRVLTEDMAPKESSDLMREARKHLESTIVEFRKRAARAK